MDQKQEKYFNYEGLSYYTQKIKNLIDESTAKTFSLKVQEDGSVTLIYDESKGKENS